MGPQKFESNSSQLGSNHSKLLSYSMVLIAGSLLGFGVLVSIGQPHRAVVVADVAPAAHESHTAPTRHEEYAEPSLHQAATHHEGGHETAGHEAPDPAELAGVQTREAFTDKVMSRFLSADCDKNRNSETGVQFGINSYSEFSGSKRTRYIEGSYRFEADGFKLIVSNDNQLDFKMNGDRVSMTRVMVAGVVVPAPADRDWKACHSNIHEAPREASKATPYDPSDGLRMALAANDLSAASHFLALGGYIPATEFSAVLKASNLEGAISTPIRNASRQNEDNTLKRSDIAAGLEAKYKAELAKQPKAETKPETKGKPKEGEHH